MTMQRTASEKNPSANEAPLLDADWLLGPKSSKFTLGRWFVLSTSLAAFVATGFVAFPRISKAWLHRQFAQQFLHGATDENRNEGIVGLAKLLPESLDTIVAGFTVTEGDQTELAFHALSHFLDQVAKLPTESRRSIQAEVAFALEAKLPTIREEALGLAADLAQRIGDDPGSDSHPATAVTRATCQRIVELQRSKGRSSSPSNPIANDESKKLVVSHEASFKQAAHEASTRRSLSDVSDASESHRASPSIFDRLQSPSLKTASTVSFQSNSLADIDASGSTVPGSPDATWQQPALPLPSIISPENSPPKHKLLQATRRFASHDTSSTRFDGTVAPTEDRHRETVVGIDRQNTRDLLQLLASSQSHLARAAFHELQRTRLTRDELELAVELAKGNSAQKIQSLEKLATNPSIDPIDWLSWMANESDRAVRFKAVSILASLNNEQAYAILRDLNNRERDLEVGQHIQQALSAIRVDSALNE